MFAYPTYLLATLLAACTSTTYINTQRTACVTVRLGGVARLCFRLFLPGVFIGLLGATLMSTLSGPALTTVIALGFFSPACMGLSYLAMGRQAMGKKQPETNTLKVGRTHGATCPEGKVKLTITSLASAEKSAAAFMSRFLLDGLAEEGYCIRARARTLFLAYQYQRAYDFVGACPKSPLELYKHF